MWQCWWHLKYTGTEMSSRMSFCCSRRRRYVGEDLAWLHSGVLSSSRGWTFVRLTGHNINNSWCKESLFDLHLLVLLQHRTCWSFPSDNQISNRNWWDNSLNVEEISVSHTHLFNHGALLNAATVIIKPVTGSRFYRIFAKEQLASVGRIQWRLNGYSL